MPCAAMPHNDPGAELRKALEPIARVAFESAHPHIPYDITLAEAERGSVVNGRFCLHPDDVAARVQGSDERRAA